MFYTLQFEHFRYFYGKYEFSALNCHQIRPLYERSDSISLCKLIISSLLYPLEARNTLLSYTCTEKSTIVRPLL